MLSTYNVVGKIVKVRWNKLYEAAMNHVCVGEVVNDEGHCLIVRGMTFHFGGIHAGSTLGVRTGQVNTRWIPWGQIAVVTELPSDLGWEKADFKLNKEGRLVLNDQHETLIEEL